MLQSAGNDQLIEALEAARRRAEREKHEKWLRKLEAGNHDTSRLRANFESTYCLQVIDIVAEREQKDRSLRILRERPGGKVF